MECERNYYQQQEKYRKAANGLSKPIGTYIPGISVHIIPPQEFKGLVQRLTGAPQFRKEPTPRTNAAPPTADHSPPSFDVHSYSENSTQDYHHQQLLHHRRPMMPSNSYDVHDHPQQLLHYEPSSASVIDQQAENNHHSTYEHYSPFSMQSPIPQSPQPFMVMDLPPLSPSDRVWAEGWR